MTNKITNADEDDIVLGAKAIGAIIGETPRRAFNLMARKAVPCWKQGGRYAASRAELAVFMTGGPGTSADTVAASRRAELSNDLARAIVEAWDKQRAELQAEKRAEAGRDDEYKRSVDYKEYMPPNTLLAQDVARLLADESFPRELWERRYRADAPQTKNEIRLL